MVENQDKITITSGCTAVIGWYCQMMELSAVIPSADEIANALAVAITVALKIFCLDCLLNLPYRAQKSGMTGMIGSQKI